MKRQKSILVLDDEADMGEIILDILTPLYEEVVFTSSPAEAKQIVSSRVFSLILTDVQMPDIPGPEFVKYVRSFGRIEPIIFLTGNATKDVVLSALRLGAADVIEKPFDTSELLQAIDRTFELEKRRLQLYETLFTQKDNESKVGSQKKMIGLLQVANNKK